MAMSETAGPCLSLSHRKCMRSEGGKKADLCQNSGNLSGISIVEKM